MSRYLIFLLWASLFFIAAHALAATSLAQGEQAQAVDEKQDDASWLVQGNTKIWLAGGVSIRDRTKIVVGRALDGTQKQLRLQVLEDFTSEVREALEAKGLTVVEPNQHLYSDEIKLKIIVTKYDAGSALERWVAPGMGSTVCIARVTIVELVSDEVLGEVVSWKHVPAGGLFSLGAHKYVPREVARAIADALASEIRE